MANQFRRRPDTYGQDDMVMLSKATNPEIHKNLKVRYDNEMIYTYIGDVLIAVNPFKQIGGLYSDSKISDYEGVPMSENAPHIYAIGNDMYENTRIDKEDQCVIISGESGAGKTVNAKLIMEYLSKVSGGGEDIKKVKEIILSTNPLLEAFGNAKTLRNDNSSRFGKYFTIKFDMGGLPKGGNISNFLLEKTRVSSIQDGERNFHIFYMLIKGLNESGVGSNYGLTNGPQMFNYLNQSSHFNADGIDDLAEFHNMENALCIIGLKDQLVVIYQILAGILWLGNCKFTENNSGQASISNPGDLKNAATFFGVEPADLKRAVTSAKKRVQSEVFESPLNSVQAKQARDSLAQGIYSRMFDQFVVEINKVLKTDVTQTKHIGVLDIYGFEVFNHNGFEQLCINYVNEKLQQIFIELTLKSEQEEYNKENIQWNPIKYFDNEPICRSIEGNPGIFFAIDDCGKTMHAQSTEKSDQMIGAKIVGLSQTHRVISSNGHGFLINHYAGDVCYDVTGFFEKNRDTLFEDMIVTMQNSKHPFLSNLFKNDRDQAIVGGGTGNRGRGNKGVTTFGMKMKQQAKILVQELKKCRPHYVRCIKPSEIKSYGNWDEARAMKQIKYLGLEENVKVRKAGFSYRRPFDKFLQRYNILLYLQNPMDAQPAVPYNSDQRYGQQQMRKICQSGGVSDAEYQFGKTKMFIKDPESVLMLETQRERIYDQFARTVQKYCSKFINQEKSDNAQYEACRTLGQRKQRNQQSIRRKYYSDYVGMDQNPEFRKYIGKREKVLFAANVKVYDAKMIPRERTLIITPMKVMICGYEEVKLIQGQQSTKSFELKYHHSLDDALNLCVSCFQDGFCLIKNVKTDDIKSEDKVNPSGTDYIFETKFLTEALYILKKKTRNGGNVNISFTSSWSFAFAKKTKGFKAKLGLGKRVKQLEFVEADYGEIQSRPNAQLRKVKNNIFQVDVLPGMPPSTQVGSASAAPKSQMNSGTIGGGQTDVFQQNFSSNNGGLSHRRSLASHKQVNLAPSDAYVDERNYVSVNQTSQNSLAQIQEQLNNMSAAPQLGQYGEGAHGDHQGGYQGGQQGGHQGGQQPRVRPSVKPKPKPKPKAEPKCKAIYSYEAQDNDELTIQIGDIIVLLSEDPSGWWQGRLNGIIGQFPGNYVEKV